MQRLQLHIFRNNIAKHTAGQTAIRGFQTVRNPKIKMRIGGKTIHDFMKAAGNHADFPIMRMQGINQIKRTVRKMHATIYIIEYRSRQILQQYDASLQCLAKIKFAIHRTCGNRRNLFANSSSGAQLIDDFLINQCGIHIHDQQTRLRKGGRGCDVRRFLFKHGFDCRKSCGQ